MDVTVNWMGRMAFEGEGASGSPVRLNSDITDGQTDSGARPMELIAIGLAGCAGMDVISVLLKKQQAVTDFQVLFHGDRARDYPRVFTQAMVEYRFYGASLDESAIVRSIELSVEKYCPVYAMLAKAFPIRSVYKIYDSESKALLKEGEYLHKGGLESDSPSNDQG
ncbi:MAG: OsmC family protein [Anaerolineales bacterium]|nr:OsmC family peroxiredoxin [Chloroflexi bacterium CFX2]MCK6583039.1 OsmC family protein [Anaerolineales bacterium]